MDNTARKHKYFKFINKILKYFGFLMILVYFAAGFLLIFSDFLSNIIYNKFSKIGIGILFVVYAIFRTYRAIKELRMEN